MQNDNVENQVNGIFENLDPADLISEVLCEEEKVILDIFRGNCFTFTLTMLPDLQKFITTCQQIAAFSQLPGTKVDDVRDMGEQAMSDFIDVVLSSFQSSFDDEGASISTVIPILEKIMLAKDVASS